jgi:hypothetical protein
VLRVTIGCPPSLNEIPPCPLPDNGGEDKKEGTTEWVSISKSYE